jgi:hypothetical protein
VVEGFISSFSPSFSYSDEVEKEKEKSWLPRNTNREESPRLALSFKGFLGVSFLIFFNRIIHSCWEELLSSILVLFCIYLFRFFVPLYLHTFICFSFSGSTNARSPCPCMAHTRETP